MARVFIDGEAGTTGLGLRARLERSPGLTVLSVPEARRKDAHARAEAMAAADVVVLCLPDAAARDAMALIEALERPTRVLDASSAHRVAPGWVYGFPELEPGQAARIAAASRVSNPGCYATGAVALLRPLIDAGLLPSDHPVCINAVSGYSGGGRTMIAAHEAAGGPAFALYGLGAAHKHAPEIALWSGLTRAPILAPSVAHLPRGMIVSVPLHLDALPGAPRADDLRDALGARYRDSPEVAVRPAEARLDAAALAGTDRLELRVHADGPRVVLTALLDNLGKGAVGAAARNLALMTGETGG